MTGFCLLLSQVSCSPLPRAQTCTLVQMLWFLDAICCSTPPRVIFGLDIPCTNPSSSWYRLVKHLGHTATEEAVDVFVAMPFGVHNTAPMPVAISYRASLFQPFIGAITAMAFSLVAMPIFSGFPWFSKYTGWVGADIFPPALHWMCPDSPPDGTDGLSAWTATINHFSMLSSLRAEAFKPCLLYIFYFPVCSKIPRRITATAPSIAAAVMICHPLWSLGPHITNVEIPGSGVLYILPQPQCGV